MFNKNKEYILKYVTKNGEEKELKYCPDKDMSTPQIINMIKNKDKDFFKLLENKKEEKIMNNLKEENNEQMDTLYDLLEYRDFEDIDIGDTTYDMIVAYSIDIEDADNDPAQEFLVRLAKSLRIITPLDIETLKTIDYVQVDLTKWVKDNFDVLESIFDFSAASKEEMIENIVIDGMEALIAGYTTNSVYELLNSKALFTESKQLEEQLINEANIIWDSDSSTDDSNSIEQEWEIKKEYLDLNIEPMIEDQLNDDIIILSGYYGSNYSDFQKSGEGGKIFENIESLEDYMADFDRVTFVDENGNLGINLYNHDGSVSGMLYTIPEGDKKIELLKALDYENQVIETYSQDEIDNNGINDLMETEFNNDLKYDSIPTQELTSHLDLLVPIKNKLGSVKTESTELEGTGEDQTQTQEDVEQAISEVENPTEKEKFAVETSNSNIDVLIADEEQAIDGYKAFLKQAKETLIPSLYDVLEKEIKEIIADEEDHINKLNTIKSAFHLEDIPLDESKKIEGVKNVNDLEVGDEITISYARGPKYTQDRSQWVKGKVININPDYVDLEVPTTLTATTKQLSDWLTKLESKSNLKEESNLKYKKGDIVPYKGKEYEIMKVIPAHYWHGQNASDEEGEDNSFVEFSDDMYEIQNPNDESDWGYVKATQLNETYELTPDELTPEEEAIQNKYDQVLDELEIDLDSPAEVEDGHMIKKYIINHPNATVDEIIELYNNYNESGDTTILE